MPARWPATRIDNMRALFFDTRLTLRDDLVRPEPAAGELLVRVRRAGICNTDIEITRGYMGFSGVLGHEFVGMLEDGTRVVGEINAHDGTCETCRRGDPTHCPNRTTLGIAGRDGALADFLTLPARNLHRVPDRVTDRLAAFVEPLAAAVEITERVHVRPTDRVAVIGDGKLGLLVAQVLRLTGCELVLVGRHKHKLSLAAARGIDTTSEPEAFEGKRDIVVECTGQPGGFELARAMLRPRGTLVLKSTFHGAQELALAPIVVDELSIVGSRCGPFEPALRLLASGLVDVEPLIEAEYPLERGLEAFEHAVRPGALKIQVVMD
ncbi:MAG: MDR/zinc-dependent alcohol dehydrogenase-like family protein [Rudaea sp.]